MAHDVAHRGSKFSLEGWFVSGLAGFTRPVRLDQVVRARQASDMARQDMIGTHPRAVLLNRSSSTEREPISWSFTRPESRR